MSGATGEPSPRHVALIGLMGSGKTVVGREVARSLGWPVVDVDDEIVRRTGCTTRQLWERGGEAAYRPLERAIALEALDALAPRVVGVPAGVAMDPTGQDRLRRTARLVVWLRAEVDTLVERVAGQHHRPLVDADPADLLRRQAAERSATYAELADLVLDVEGRTPVELAATIVAVLRPRSGANGRAGDDWWVPPPNARLWPADHEPTPFQARVVELVAELGPGELATYAELAEEAGRPGAAQAVANVLRSAPDLPWWRVLPSGGRIYRTHQPAQRPLLEAEGHRVDHHGRVHPA